MQSQDAMQPQASAGPVCCSGAQMESPESPRVRQVHLPGVLPGLLPACHPPAQHDTYTQIRLHLGLPDLTIVYLGLRTSRLTTCSRT